MHSFNSERLRRFVLAVGDWLLVAGCCLAAYFIRFSSGWIPVSKGFPAFGDFVGITLLTACLWVWAFNWAGVYANRHPTTMLDELYQLLVGIVVGSLAVGALSFLVHALWYSRLVLGLTAAVAAVTLPVWHVTVRSVADHLGRRGIGVRQVAIVGTDAPSMVLADRLRAAGPLLRLAGFLQAAADSPAENLPAPVLGRVTALPDLAAARSFDEIWVPPGSLSPRNAVRLVAETERLQLNIKFVVDQFDLLKHHGTPENIGGVQLLAVRYVRLTGVQRVLKRLVDVFGAGILLVVLSPAMLVIALLIRVTSKGPALYIQERVGLHGKPFKMLKFRTMREDAEAETGPVWATDTDPRRTPIGAFLRRTSLDETPQLINVLMGTMSLVGPRPERPYFVEQFRKRIPRYDERHAVKGGITGWAQVHGLRGNSSIVERTLYDLEYVENWSLELDLEILVKTAFEVLFHRTAY